MAALLLLAACADQAATETQTETAAMPESTAPAMEGAKITAQEDLALNVGDRVFFDFDKSDLRPDAIETLNRQASWLSANGGVTVTIEGHCDERGTREYNLALGGRRAAAAKQYLESTGVDGGRIDTVSYGKERPAVLGSNEAAWAQNRRAVMVVRSGEIAAVNDTPDIVSVDDVQPGKPYNPSGGDGEARVGANTPRDGGSAGDSVAGSGGYSDAGGGNGSEIGRDGLDRDPGNSGNSRGRSRSND